MADAGERSHADLVSRAGEREIHAWKQLEVFSPVKTGALSGDVVGTQLRLAWKEAGGKRTAKARLVAKG